jgi:REP element-mobilizing transposase RayT
MPRARRVEVPGGIFHVTTRGNDRMSIYPALADRRSWVRTLEHATELARWETLSWAEVGNHYHVVLRTPQPTLAYGMQVLNTLHAKNVNRRHGRQDHLFGRRYTSTFVESAGHFQQVLRYVAWNPVKAGLCRSPRQWRWSSYGRTSRGAAAPAVDHEALAGALETTTDRVAGVLRAIVEEL